MFAILLDNPKYPHHVGQAVRLAACFDGGVAVFVTGTRCKHEVDRMHRIPREERMKDYGHVELHWVGNRRAINDVIDNYGVLCGTGIWTPVCVEVGPTSEKLPQFVHPTNGLYVFGPEDGDVRDGFRRTCHRFVEIPTKHCLNLGHAMAVTMYDREAKIGAMT